jgi:hypothetical protein
MGRPWLQREASLGVAERLAPYRQDETSLEADRLGSVVLAALYLPGGKRAVCPPLRNWPEVLHHLRAAAAKPSNLASSEEVAAFLRRRGLFEEAVAILSPGLLEWAREQVARGRVLAAPDPRYPRRWLKRLSQDAPPALWKSGEWTEGCQLAFLIDAAAGTACLRLAAALAVRAERLGFRTTGVGGHAPLRTATFFPGGLGHRNAASGCAVSCFAWDEPVAEGRRQRCEVLACAAAEAAVVLGVRYREGTAWRGATEALRRKLCPLLVWCGPGADGRAAEALVALGGAAIESAGDFENCLRRALQVL